MSEAFENANHVAVVDYRMVVGDKGRSDLSYAQGSAKSFATYYNRLDGYSKEYIKGETMSLLEIEPQQNNTSHEYVPVVLAGTAVTSAGLATAIHDIRELDKRTMKNVWPIIRKYIPSILAGAGLIVVGCLIERNEHES